MVTISGAILVSLSRLFHNSNNSESDNTLPAYPNFWKHEEVKGLSVKRGVGVGAYLFFF